MDESISLVAPTCSNVSSGISTANPATEEPRICPLCSSTVRFFFIHFNDKVLMCENTKCDFPFGYEDLQFISADEGKTFEAFSTKAKNHIPNTIGENISSLPWTEIDTNSFYREQNSAKDKYYKIFEKQKELKKNLKLMIGKAKESVEVHGEINEMSRPKTTLKNRKYIKNLAYFPGVSGNPLPNPYELDQLKTVKSDFSFEKGETKLNIELGCYNTISSINLDIADKIK